MYDLGRTKYIEINGDSTKQTIITISNNKICYVICSQYFSITNIIFFNTITFRKYPSHDCEISYDTSEFHANNCTFENESVLSIILIDVIHVSSCFFNNGRLLIENNEYLIKTYYITRNIFTTDINMKCIKSFSTLSFYSTCNNLFYTNIIDNIISNTKSCIRNRGVNFNLIIESNTFTNVDRLCHGEINGLIRSKDNKCIDCGSDMILYDE